MHIQTKLLLVIGMSLFFIFMGVELVHYRNVKQEIQNNLQEQAEKVRSLLMAYRHVQQKVFLEKNVPLNDVTINFLPAYAIGRISENYPDWDGSGFSFNNVSDKPRNPANMADKIELEAMDYFRANPNKELLFKPFTDAGEHYYLYARPIWIKQICLKCHSKREDAPETIRNLYDNAWDYKIGELRGILSIKLPTNTINKRVWYSFKQDIVIQLLGFITIFILILILIRRNVTQPLTKLADSIQTFAYKDHTHRAIEFDGEFGTLSKAFNNMANEIVAQQEILKNEVAARKKEQEFLQNVIDSLNHPFYVINANNYQVELANLFMHKFDPKTHITCHKLTHYKDTPCDDKRTPCPLMEVKKTKKPVILEHIHNDKNGNTRNIEIHGFPIFDNQNNVIKMIEYSLDITKRKANEEALLKSEKHLSVALEKAETANKAKSQFLANMTHELRTPMIAIMGYTELLLEDTELTEEQEYYLRSVVNSSKKLLSIINDILDISAIETKKIYIKSIDFQLEQLLDNIFELFNKDAEKKGIKLKLATDDNIPRNLVGDPLRIRQVLINLVNNAIKFSKGGEITIYTKMSKIKLGQVTLRFSIQDTGIGISTDTMPYLFDTFNQADNSYTREFGGAGSGLAICKYLIDMMGGYIWVNSELGKGSTFNFTITLSI
ncbi:DUF3365 domain-containing protein [Candidatus Halobeggiatoa sp. HSG11]|nr:DUF3365 domain-containing protein [Candidatus Halobeggiatoa sp. HSG11]